jgi:hypothetical protein
MREVRFEPTTAVFERAKKVHALVRVANEIGNWHFTYNKKPLVNIYNFYVKRCYDGWYNMVKTNFMQILKYKTS